MALWNGGKSSWLTGELKTWCGKLPSGLSLWTLYSNVSLMLEHREKDD